MRAERMLARELSRQLHMLGLSLLPKQRQDGARCTPASWRMRSKPTLHALSASFCIHVRTGGEGLLALGQAPLQSQLEAYSAPTLPDAKVQVIFASLFTVPH